MAERSPYSPEKIGKGMLDTEALLLVSAMTVFAIIGFFVTAPLRR